MRTRKSGSKVVDRSRHQRRIWAGFCDRDSHRAPAHDCLLRRCGAPGATATAVRDAAAGAGCIASTSRAGCSSPAAVRGGSVGVLGSARCCSTGGAATGLLLLVVLAGDAAMLCARRVPPPPHTLCGKNASGVAPAAVACSWGAIRCLAGRACCCSATVSCYTR
jgi:hypothetical protein